ncbi:hypothetical protein A0H81_01597 [Grifola frondosa]|uniref:Uncharacterized protein n=1 Tax=Grifola frondosa TaxID=5627 RepID=A0A1C7MNL1_GRIFR|nr:hypothetical protein A0H81_01597 [Grifola frondosa]
MLPKLRCRQGHAGTPLLLPSLRKDASDFAVLCAALVGLYTLPVANDIAWCKVFNALAPTVTFEETTPQAAATLAAPALSKPRSSLLDSCADLPSAEGVVVSGFALCPASVYRELAPASAQHVLECLAHMPADTVLDLARIIYSNPLVYSPDIMCTVRTDNTLNASGEKYAGAFTISSYTTGGERQLHCTASSTSEATRRAHRSLRSSNGARRLCLTPAPRRVLYTHSVRPSLLAHHHLLINLPQHEVYRHPGKRDRRVRGRAAASTGSVINCNAGTNEAFSHTGPQGA